MNRVWRFLLALPRRWHLSLFEKVIVVNSLLLLVGALAGLWVTSHTLEAHHYLIDTMFIVVATLLGLAANFVLLRMSFRPSSACWRLFARWARASLGSVR